MKYNKILSKTKQGFKIKFSINKIIIIFIISILLKESQLESYIELKINDAGNISIYSKHLKNLVEPDIIDINGENMSDFANYYYFNNINNTVKLTWINKTIENTSYMFYNCINITEIDLSHFDFSNVVSMDYMFSGCISLISINLSNINTINPSEINTGKVQDMSYLFSNCSSLISLDLSGFNTSNVNNMKYMFYNCRSLVSLDISNFITSKVKFIFILCFIIVIVY